MEGGVILGPQRSTWMCEDHAQMGDLGKPRSADIVGDTMRSIAGVVSISYRMSEYTGRQFRTRAARTEGVVVW